MLIYAIFCLIVASFATRYFSKKATDAGNADNYMMKRVYNFLTTVTAMSVAWAWLYWGEWEFFEALYPGEAIKGRVMFAVSTTVVGGCGLIGLSKIKSSGKGQAMMQERKVALTALALVVAWSW